MDRAAAPVRQVAVMTFDGTGSGRGRVGVVSATGCGRSAPVRRIGRVSRVSVAIVTPEGPVKVLAAVHPRLAGATVVQAYRRPGAAA